MSFGNTLKRLIDVQEITQKDLAEYLNVAPSTVGNYVADTREPDFDTLKLIATYFKVSTDYLLDYQQPHALNHDEDYLLRVYRFLPEEYQALLLDEGRLFLKHSKKSIL